MTTQMEHNYDKLSLHFKYCGFMAAMVVVAIATEKWSASQAFTTYLSNAATMTSLLLGVVAIFYSFISNDGMSKSLGSIATVSDEVNGVRTEIEQFSRLTKEATRESENNTLLVRNASNELTGSLGELSSTLKELSVQNEALKGLVSILPNRIDQLETKFGDVAKAWGEKPQPLITPAIDQKIPDPIIERFLARASLSQNLLMYACVLAVETKKQLSLPDFCEAVEVSALNYYSGFLACMNAAQICSRLQVEGQDRIYDILSINQTLENRSKTYFVDYIENTLNATRETKDSWINKLNAVEAMFK